VILYEKVAVACPPEDVVKKEKVTEWIESESELAGKVREALKNNRIRFK
jgi:hypothetical protein